MTSILTLREACALLRCCRATLRALVRRGLLPSYRAPHDRRRRYFRPEDVERLAATLTPVKEDER